MEGLLAENPKAQAIGVTVPPMFPGVSGNPVMTQEQPVNNLPDVGHFILFMGLIWRDARCCIPNRVLLLKLSLVEPTFHHFQLQQSLACF